MEKYPYENVRGYILNLSQRCINNVQRVKASELQYIFGMDLKCGDKILHDFQYPVARSIISSHD